MTIIDKLSSGRANRAARRALIDAECAAIDAALTGTLDNADRAHATEWTRAAEDRVVYLVEAEDEFAATIEAGLCRNQYHPHRFS